MPKMKSHSGARKRFKKLKTGIFKASKPGRRHLLTKKSAAKKRHMRRGFYIDSCDLIHIERLLPH